ncbi:MAG TPA: hypothetical protein VJR02_29420 [Pyrinomonadaceae bacterium]|nr:hypothetical protein [Pyrinomonadaceae bacterium]
MNLKFVSQKTKVMKRVLFISLVMLVAFGAHQGLRAQTPTAPDEKHATQPKKRGGIFTMYINDPLARTMCLSDGKEGFAFVDNEWRNRCSDLTYVLASGGSLASGIEVNRVAAIVDLGTPEELRSRYGFEEAPNGFTGFASIHLNGNKVMILKQDLGKPEYQSLQEGAKLFTDVAPSANVPIKLGHIYVVRIADKKDTSFQQIAKLMVIAYRPEESVTVRWETL